MRIFSIIIVLSIASLNIYAQSFSEDPTTFSMQAVSILESTGSEAYKKVAFDFQNTWNTKLTSQHQQKIIEIALLMKKKGFAVNPHFMHLFAYISNGVTIEGIQATELDGILDINLNSLKTLGYEEYARFLFGMNTFLGGRYLYMGKNIVSLAEGGSYTFELIGELPEPDPIESILAVEETAEDFDPFATFDNAQEEEINQTDDWNTTNDDWSTTSSDWSTTSNDWGSANDDWGNTDDQWSTATNDDSWGNDTWGSDNSFSQEPVYDVIPSREAFVPSQMDYTAAEKAKYVHPVSDGPVIHLSNVKFIIITKFDSLSLSNVIGDHIIKDQTFAGTQAEMAWPMENKKMKGASVTLKEFNLKVDRGNFATPNATLKFPDLFEGLTEGVLKYNSVRRDRGTLSSYPIFTSFENDIKISIPGGKATYEGGIELRGNELYGKSISQKKGTLTVLNGKGQTVIFKSNEFHIEDSIVSSPSASVSIISGEDSIYHPAVQVEYFIAKNKIVMLRNNDFDVTPFHSTYHKIGFGIDLIKWNLDDDSINLSIMNGKDLLPATFESDKYFSEFRYKRMSGMYLFHPIGLSAHYARKYNIEEFNVMELVSEYELSINEVKGAMKMLQQYHYCEYDEQSGQVKLLPIAFHYYESAAKKKDFDNVFISSKISGGPNAIFDLKTSNLNVFGVNKFYMTTDFKIFVAPKEGKVTIKKDREISFDGELDAGDFNYKGHEFHFDYDAFIIKMDSVDSIRIQLPVPDSLASFKGEKKALSNHLTETSGTLYLDRPDNKSGKKKLDNYPYFVSESDAIVYFDGKDVLNGAYDKSVKFIIPPMELDNIDSASAIIMPGLFNSGGIFPDFEDTLHIMPDQSLGFIHQIPDGGYQLYGTPARTYETITISNKGMRGLGKIDFLNSSISSEDFIYYPDSVTADGNYGTIKPGKVGKASFPQAEMGTFRMYWLPYADSMYLQTIGDPFKFYNATAQLTGKANITQGGVYGSGSMLTRGSIAESQQMTFEEYNYSAYHAKFSVLSDDPEKPAMFGEDIRLNFDLTKNVADVHPEQAGVAAISFPYAQMKTSITNAEWFLEDSIITMTKPVEVPIEDSYFYSTLKDLDSLAFNANQAVYDISKYELNVKGIPFIDVADVKIIPENNETTIHANSVLETLNNAELIFEYPNANHYLTKGVINIQSRNEFSGIATYQLPVGEDTFEIEMSNFYMEERFEKSKTILSSKATGIVSAESNLNIAPGFLYKGNAVLRVFKQPLELEGFIRPDFKSINNIDNWIAFKRTDEQEAIKLDIGTSVYEDGDPVIAGIHFGTYGKLYTTFLEKRITPGDDDLFLAKGLLTYDQESGDYIIENPLKTTGEKYEGHTLIYSDSSQSIIFEGMANFINPLLNPVEIKSSILGVGNRKTNEYSLDALLTFDLKLPATTLNMMALDVLDIIERLGNPQANDLSLESMLKLSNIIGEAATRSYETRSLKDYLPLSEASPLLNKSLVISGVKMKWNDSENAWYNTTKLGLSNILGQDINAKVDGFLEFRKDDTGGDVMNLFLQAAPGSWYYFNYQENSLMIYSSNRIFNDEITAKSNYGNTKAGELVLIAGDENETLKFINNFRKVYFGIDEPYNLAYPDDVTLDDEGFETIKKDDDGF